MRLRRETITVSQAPVEAEASASPVDMKIADSERLVSLDALRGFDMFWIMGGAAVFQAAAEVTGWNWLSSLCTHMEHPVWHGFEMWDLIFPLFLFIAGVATPFSIDKRLGQGASRASVYRHIVRRGLLLVLLGMIYNGLLQFRWADMRYPSVLGRIGLAYLFAALIVMNTQWRGRILWIIGLLLGYWAAIKLIPVPGLGAGDFSPGHTLTDYIDRQLIPGRLYRGDRDPEGLLATVPAIATALLGAVTGQLLQSRKLGGYRKTLVMLLMAVFCLGAAWLWNRDFPINKNLWSSSFVLHCAGLSLLLLSFFYLVIDVWHCRRGAFVFVVIGTNSILIYLAPEFIDFEYTSRAIFGGAMSLVGKYEPLLLATSVLLIEWLTLLLCYRKRIFLKV